MRKGKRNVVLLNRLVPVVNWLLPSGSGQWLKVALLWTFLWVLGQLPCQNPLPLPWVRSDSTAAPLTFSSRICLQPRALIPFTSSLCSVLGHLLWHFCLVSCPIPYSDIEKLSYLCGSLEPSGLTSCSPRDSSGGDGNGDLIRWFCGYCFLTSLGFSFYFEPVASTFLVILWTIQ